MDQIYERTLSLLGKGANDLSLEQLSADIHEQPEVLIKNDHATEYLFVTMDSRFPITSILNVSPLSSFTLEVRWLNPGKFRAIPEICLLALSLAIVKLLFSKSSG